MTRILVFSVFLMSLFVCSSFTSSVHAQVKGQYNPAPIDGDADSGNLDDDVIVARVFSSKMSNPKRGEKLDRLFHNLNATLAALGTIDNTFKSQLWELMQPYKFQLTRRSNEFDSVLEKSLESLNNNYKASKTAFEEYKAETKKIVDRISGQDGKVASKTREETIQAFEKKRSDYFQLQYRYLKQYRSMVKFIIAQNGSYYYDSATDKIGFYEFGIYHKWAKFVDELRKIDYKQRVQLRANIYASTIVTD